LPSKGFTQEASLSASSGSAMPGGTAALNLSLNSTPGSEPSALQWTINYPAADFSALSVTAGPAAQAAGKSISCSSGAGTSTCLLWGMNSTPISNGVAAVAAFTVSATTSSTSSAVQMTNAFAATATGSSATLSASGGVVTISQPTPSPATLSNLACNPTSVQTPGSSNCTVSLSAAAPAGGAVVALASNSASLAAPASIAVPAGSAAASFTATASTVSANTTATLTASYGGVSRTFSVSLVAPDTPATLSSLACSPSSLTGAASSTCTVSLTKAATTSMAIALASNSANLLVPSSVTVPAEAGGASFTATARAVSVNESVVVSAVAGGETRTATVTLQAAPVDPTLTSLTCSPATVFTPGSASCTMNISAPAPAGATAEIVSNNAVLTVPHLVTIPAGASSIGFTASAAPVNDDLRPVLTAYLFESTTSYTLTLMPSVTLSSLNCSPSSVIGSNPASCTVALTAAAPDGGALVNLTDNSGSVSVPASVSIPAGATSATFSASTSPVSATQAAVMTATVNSQSVTATISVLPASLQSFSCASSSLSVPGSVNCTVQLDGPAPAAGTGVVISSSATSVSFPEVVTISGGATSATFAVTAAEGAASGQTTLTASLGSISRTFALTVGSTLGVSSFSCSPSTLIGGGYTTCQVALSAPAPANGSSVSVRSSNPLLTPPSAVIVPSGLTSLDLRVSSALISSDQSATLTATLNAVSRTANITLVGIRPISLSCQPATVKSGDRSRCELRLNSSDAPVPLTVDLTSSSPAVRVPASVTYRARQSKLNFYAYTSPVPTTQNVVLTARYGDATTQGTLVLLPNAAPTLTTEQEQILTLEAGKPVVARLTNAASHYVEFACSSGAIATATGSFLAEGMPLGAAQLPPPTELNGSRVKVNGEYLPMLYASATQINFQCPQTGDELIVVVERGAESSLPVSIRMLDSAPGIFTLDASGHGQGAILLGGTTDFVMVRNALAPSMPAQAGDYVVLFATGLGRARELPVVLVGGERAEVVSAIQAPGLVGVHQITLRIPASIPEGDEIPVTIQTVLPDGRLVTSNTVTIAIESLN